MTEKTPNYSDAQVALIFAAIAANGGIADKSVAEKLASDSRMNDGDEPRKVRSIIAKMTRMDGVEYVKQAPQTKDGKPVTKKTDLVSQIAEMAGVTVGKLAGLENAPKLALETLVGAWPDVTFEPEAVNG